MLATRRANDPDRTNRAIAGRCLEQTPESPTIAVIQADDETIGGVVCTTLLW